MKMLRLVTLFLPPAVICFALATAHAVEAQAPPEKLPDAPGKAVVVGICTSCHDSALITDSPRTVAGWEDTLNAMKEFGAMATEAEWKTILDYLVTNLALLEVNKATAAQMQLVFGITDTAAADVVAYREKQGGFKTIDDLKTAPGLDAATIDTLKDRLIFK